MISSDEIDIYKFIYIYIYDYQGFFLQGCEMNSQFTYSR